MEEVVEAEVVSEDFSFTESVGVAPIIAKLKHSCPYCPYSTDHLGNFNTHMNKHSPTHAFSCPSCSFRTSYKNSLKKHLQRHEVKTSVVITQQKKISLPLEYHREFNLFRQYIQCDHCSFRSDRLCNIKRHWETTHK